MIDLNDGQINKNGQRDKLLSNTVFKDEIESEGCPGLKEAKYINGL